MRLPTSSSALLSLILSLALLSANSFAQKKTVPVPKKQPAISELSPRQIADKVLRSVVLVITQDEYGRPISQGSGFVYRPGLIVSNLHVFERATTAIVKNVITGETSEAVKVVGMNAKDDICVFQIANTKFPAISLGESDSIKTGDEVYVASNPKGLEGTFSKGIISGKRGKDLLQLDAAVSPGSSGGAVVDQDGKVIGIVTSSLLGGQNLNFAVPINKLKNLPLDFNHPVQLAGACAYSDTAKEKLKGRVKSVTESRIDLEGSVNKNSVSVYDLQGNLIEWTIFDLIDGAFAFKDIYTYDENRLRTSMTQQTRNDVGEKLSGSKELGIKFKVLERKFSGSFGDLNNKGGLQIYDRDGNMNTWYIGGGKLTFEYDSEGRAIEAIQWRDGKIQIKKRFRYQYDEYGNWLKKTSNRLLLNLDSENWYEDETEYRELTYYDSR